jgi:hypothetical protein
MKQTIIKLFNDTLKTPKGKWSRTSLTMFTCLFAALSYLGFELINHGKFYIEAFYALLGVSTGMKWIDVVDKHKTKNAEVENQ